MTYFNKIQELENKLINFEIAKMEKSSNGILKSQIMIMIENFYNSVFGISENKIEEKAKIIYGILIEKIA